MYLLQLSLLCYCTFFDKDQNLYHFLICRFLRFLSVMRYIWIPVPKYQNNLQERTHQFVRNPVRLYSRNNHVFEVQIELGKEIHVLR